MARQWIGAYLVCSTAPEAKKGKQEATVAAAAVAPLCRFEESDCDTVCEKRVIISIGRESCGGKGRDSETESQSLNGRHTEAKELQYFFGRE